MKRTSSTGSHLLIVVVFFVLALGGAHPAAGESIDYIKERREFIACVSPRAEPYSDAILMIETPSYPGFQIDMAEKLAKKIGVGLKLSWINSFFNAEKVKCDAFMGLAQLEQEPAHPFLKPTIPYLHVKSILVSNKDHHLKGLKDFQGLRVAADTSTAVQDILRKQDSGAELFVSYIEDNKKFDALRRGDIDVALVTTVSLGWYQKNHPGFQPVITPASVIAPNSEYDFALGLHNADAKTVALFNDYLEEMITSGALEKIFKHYGVPSGIAKN